MGSTRPSKARSGSAFTLIELLVVISIVALLSSVVLASLNAAREKARIAAGMRFAQSSHSAVGSEAVALYNFDEGSGATAVDLSLNGNDGTISGATYSSASYRTTARYALGFDGADDYVSVPHNENQLLAQGGTVAAWIHPTGIGEANAGRIVDKSTDIGPIDGYGVWMTTSNRIAFRIGSAGTGVISQNDSIPYNRWTHILVTWTASGAVSIYVNGALSSAGSTNSPSQITATTDLRIGNRSGGTDRTFGGLIDDVRIYSRVLTTFEAGRIYAESAPKYRFANAE